MHFLRNEKEEPYRIETFLMGEKLKLIKREKGVSAVTQNDYAEAPFLGIRFKNASNSVNIAIQSLNHTLKIIQQR